MSTSWENIADSLRAELAEYGALLNLFEDQQRGLFELNAERVLRLSAAIEGQLELLGARHSHRERLVAEFAVAQGLPAATTLRALLPHVESDARPLLEALIDEVNRLLHRVRRTSRHNHTLLASVVQVHQETLQELRPQIFSKTYAPSGRVSVSAAAVPSTLQRAG